MSLVLLVRNQGIQLGWSVRDRGTSTNAVQMLHKHNPGSIPAISSAVLPCLSWSLTWRHPPHESPRSSIPAELSLIHHPQAAAKFTQTELIFSKTSIYFFPPTRLRISRFFHSEDAAARKSSTETEIKRCLKENNSSWRVTYWIQLFLCIHCFLLSTSARVTVREHTGKTDRGNYKAGAT